MINFRPLENYGKWRDSISENQDISNDAAKTIMGVIISLLRTVIVLSQFLACAVIWCSMKRYMIQNDIDFRPLVVAVYLYRIGMAFIDKFLRFIFGIPLKSSCKPPRPKIYRRPICSESHIPRTARQRPMQTFSLPRTQFLMAQRNYEDYPRRKHCKKRHRKRKEYRNYYYGGYPEDYVYPPYYPDSNVMYPPWYGYYEVRPDTRISRMESVPRQFLTTDSMDMFRRHRRPRARLLAVDPEPPRQETWVDRMKRLPQQFQDPEWLRQRAQDVKGQAAYVKEKVRTLPDYVPQEYKDKAKKSLKKAREIKFDEVCNYMDKSVDKVMDSNYVRSLRGLPPKEPEREEGANLSYSMNENAHLYYPDPPEDQDPKADPDGDPQYNMFTYNYTPKYADGQCRVNTKNREF